MVKEWIIGMAVGLIATGAGFFLYLEFGTKFGFDHTLEMVRDGDLYGKVLSLAVLPNLFVFLKKNQELRARGVLLATILIAIFTFALKLF